MSTTPDITRIAQVLGWTVEDTGAGRALVLQQFANRFYVATDMSGGTLPKWGEDFSIGMYGAPGADPENLLDSWTPYFVSDCDALGRRGYVVYCNGMAICDPTVGTGAQWERSVDPFLRHGVRAPVAQLMALLYVVATIAGQRP